MLRLRDAAGAQALVRAVSTPGSVSYRHYLSTARWEARFSPSAAEVSTVRTWLRSQGFTVGAASLALRNAAVRGSTPMRVNPDISIDADPSTGFLIGLHQTFPGGKARYSLTRYGGTSLASPLLAGVIADADQAAIGSNFVADLAK